MIQNKTDLICILGPTASGKTTLATSLAYEFKGEIISADSRQVYRGLDIGSGKDLSEYTVNGQDIPYYLIDIVDPLDEYNVFQFQHDFLSAYKSIKSNSRVPILVGGTGLYLDAILKGYRLLEVPINLELRDSLSVLTISSLIDMLKEVKPLHNQTDITDKDRAVRAIEIAKYEKNNPELKKDFPKINPIIFGIEWEPEQLRKQIKIRLEHRLNEGMVEEVDALIKQGVSEERLIRFGLEYKWCTQYLRNDISHNDLVQGLSQAIGKFAKRQRTWFRRMEKQGIKINWIDGTLALSQQIELVKRIFHN